MKIFKSIPMFLILLVVYNILEFTGTGPDGGTALRAVLFEFPLMSGASVGLDVGALLMIIGLHFVYFEVLKSLRSSTATIISHTLSLIVFIVFLIEFIVVRRAGTIDFLILTVMSLLVVISGFTVSISSARRDVMMDR